MKPGIKESSATAVTTVAKNMRRLRNEKGWSQEMLARFADLHPTQISRMERGLRQPRLKTVMQVAAALKVTILDLTTEHVEMVVED